MSTVTQKKNLTAAWQLCLALVVGAAAFMAPDLAAAADTPIGAIFCTAVGWMTGNTGKGIATIAVTIIGIGALLGKVSWGMALIVGLGIAIVFGAAGVIDAFNGSGVSIASGCNTTGSWSTR